VKRKISNLIVNKEENDENDDPEIKKSKNEAQIKAELLQVKYIFNR
jgi:hypothetical protein